MSVEIMSWARTQFGLKPGTKIVLYVLADEASSDGLVYAGQAKLAWMCEITERNVRDHLKALEERGLLHRERRAKPWVHGGRETDVIVLHPEVAGNRGAFPGAAEERRQRAENRRRYEVPFEAGTAPEAPSVSPSQEQPEIFVGNPVDNCVFPSQAEPEKFSGKGSLTGKTASLEPENLRQNSLGALRGTRARLVPSSPIQSSDRNDAGGVGSDGTGSDDISLAVDDRSGQGGQPTPPLAYRGVPLGLLRSKLGGGSGVLAGVDDPTLSEVIDLVFARALGPVVSPLGLMIRALRQPGAAEELLEEAAAMAQAKAEHGGFGTVAPVSDAAWAQIEDEMRESVAAAEEAEAKRLVVCPVHHIQHPAAVTCPGCRADELTASTTGEDTAGEAEVFDVEAWRAKRQEQRRAAAEQARKDAAFRAGGSSKAGDR